MVLELKRPLAVAGLIAFSLSGTAVRAEAAFDMFLKLDGIQGSSKDARHAGEIVVESVAFGLANTGSASFGGGGGAGKVQFTDISFTKKLDKSSPDVMNACMTGSHIKSATLTCRKAGGKQEDFYKVTLSDVLVSSYSLSSGGDLPTESISLNFTKVDWEYLVQRPDGSFVPGSKGSFDVKLNKGSVAGTPTPGGTSGTVAAPSRLPVLSSSISSPISSVLRTRGVSDATIFAKVSGIEGEATDARHAREIEIHSFSWGMTNSGTMAFGGGAGMGKVKFNDLTQTKSVDKASVPLMLNCAQGRRIPEVVVTFVRAGNRAQEFLKVKFSDVLVSSIQQSGAPSGDRPMESLSINFAKMEWEFFDQRPDGTLVPAGKVGYDLALNKKL
jgi:type VI secretion system secreted protein Hcp